MKYFCPICKYEMEGIYCDCEMVAGIHLSRGRDGKLWHQCGKPIHPEKQKDWEKQEPNKGN